MNESEIESLKKEIEKLKKDRQMLIDLKNAKLAVLKGKVGLISPKIQARFPLASAILKGFGKGGGRAAEALIKYANTPPAKRPKRPRSMFEHELKRLAEA